MIAAPAYEIDPKRRWDDPYRDLGAMRARAMIAFAPEPHATLFTRRDHILACERMICAVFSEQPGGLKTVLMGRA